MTHDHHDVALTDRARAVWAKTRTDPHLDFALTGWLPLYQHLDDTAAVAELVWDEWAPASVKDTISACIGSESAARALVVWLAGTHDVGKASPAFAVQVPVLADDMIAAGLPVHARVKDDPDRPAARHELVGFLAIREWLCETHGFTRRRAEQIASVVAAHHGRPADHALIRRVEPLPHLVGAGAWIDVRREFLARADTAHALPFLDEWRDASLTQPALVLLSGLVIVADWIASSDHFDPVPLRQHPDRSAAVRAAEAWRSLDFPGPWRPAPDSSDVAELLTTRFGLAADVVPHPTQREFIDQARRVAQPELMILEAEMGSGKTEAALLAAEILSSRFGLSGVFVGLPTQATADGMFGRVLSWADRLGLDVPSSIFLARGKATLNPEFAEKTRQAHFRSIGDAEASRHDASGSLVIAHRWFSNPRRGPLSNFVVGTVDQALFAGLRGRYLMLRHLALASKVVVIDEAHAYDAYMREYLVRVLEWLGAYSVPVILLSATLPASQRRAFLEAYDRGRDALRAAPEDLDLPGHERLARQAAADERREQRYRGLAGDIGYPVVSVSSATGAPTVARPDASHPSRPIRLDRIDDDDENLVDLLRSALREGGNVAVIRNTVRRAQQTAAVLRDALGTDATVTLAHSRFLALDRARKDRELLAAYGRKGDRPRSSVVVATQVIEQSLDIDFDLIVTDAAPIDLLLQRSGRLHRHAERVRPAPLRAPRLVLVADAWQAVPPTFAPGSTSVYSEKLLLRTAAALLERDLLDIPDDIAPLVETVYGDSTDFIPSSWRDALDAAAAAHATKQLRQSTKAQNYLLRDVATDHPSLIGWITGPDVDPEVTPPGTATVRDAEETLEVLVLQRDDAGGLILPRWIDEVGGRRVPDNEAPSPALTRAILGCALRLPAAMCRAGAIDRHIATLERAFELPTWHSSHALKGELVLVLDSERRAQLNEFDLSYGVDDGFEFVYRKAVS